MEVITVNPEEEMHSTRPVRLTLIGAHVGSVMNLAT